MAEAQTLPNYQPGPVERFGRRYKMEYVGMASVFAIIGLGIFGGLTPWYLALAATLATYGLFLGIKKKTRDHLSASLLLFGASALGLAALAPQPRWALPWLFFGMCVFVMEGYVEKLQKHIYALPLVFAAWGATDLSWLLGFVFAALYLTAPLPDKPGWRRRLTWTLALAAAAGAVATVVRYSAVAVWPARVVPGTEAMVALAAAAVAVVVVVVAYRRRLLPPHRWNGLLFALLAPWDARLGALFAMVAAVVLAASVFRLSIDSVRLRPFFKHAEWFFFWLVLALAIWTGFHV